MKYLLDYNDLTCTEKQTNRLPLVDFTPLLNLPLVLNFATYFPIKFMISGQKDLSYSQPSWGR